MLVRCQCCGRELPTHASWYVCNTCGFRVCMFCLSKHQGPYSKGGYKCSQCRFGTMVFKERLDK